MGRRDARGLGQNSDFGTIYLHYTIVSRKSQIKMADKKGEKPVFFRQGRQGNPFWGDFFPKPARKFFFCPFLPADFSTLPPPATTVSTGKCGKLCGNCEKPLSPCGFSLSPVFTMAFVYVNEPAYFSFLERKSPFFGLRSTPKIQAESGLCPPYLVSSGKGQISFPQFVHRDLTYISYLALGPPAPAGKPCKPKETPMQFPDFVVY